jgi:hypothetical protein
MGKPIFDIFVDDKAFNPKDIKLKKNLKNCSKYKVSAMSLNSLILKKVLKLLIILKLTLMALDI